MAEKKQAKEQLKCKTNPLWVFAVLIIATIGIWLLGQGFIAQLSTTNAFGREMDPLWAPILYFFGLLFLLMAKIAKHKACQNCPECSKK